MSFPNAKSYASHQSAGKRGIDWLASYTFAYCQWNNSGTVTSWITENDDGTLTRTKGLVRDDGYIFPGSTDHHRVDTDLAWSDNRASITIDENGSSRLSGRTIWGVSY